jgi:hypothetical protein
MYRPRVFLTVDFDESNGFVYARSSQLPGLFVCASTKADARKEASAAIAALFARTYHMIVEVLPESEDGLWVGESSSPDNEKYAVARL